MRSLLIAPGNDETKLAAALASDGDVVVIDLDLDVGARETARANAARFLKEAARRPGRPTAMVRIGPLCEGETDRDLDAIIAAAPCAVLLPKARGGASVQHLSVKLALHEALCGLDDGETGIIAAVDTAETLLHLASFRGASARLIGLSWDAESLRVDIGAETARDSKGAYAGVFRLAREMTLVAAAAAGVAAIDTASAESRDGGGVMAETHAARRSGFVAKLAISQTQAAIIDRVCAEKEFDP